MFEHRRRALAAGAVGGLAWAGSLRAYMVELAGFGSRVDWVGTFAQILLPGAIVGALLGLAEYIRRTGGRRGWRWLAAAPVLFAIAPLLTPGAFIALVTTGIGGGAIAVPLIGVGGGYAISGRGALWSRIVTGVLAVVLALAGAAAPFGMPAPARFLDPRDVWGALLFVSPAAVFAAACSIPHRAVVAIGSAIERPAPVAPSAGA